MIRLGLTGSIGMGKSTIAGLFAAEGVPVWDADAAVHRLYAEDEVLQHELTTAFGNVLSDGRVDRVRLAAAIHRTPNGFERLNALVHPRVVQDRELFLNACMDAPVVLADIPLLYETAAEGQFDKVVVVSAPPGLQRQRVLARPGMTEARFQAILQRQISDTEKRRRADYVIDTSQSLDACREQVRDILAELQQGRA